MPQSGAFLFMALNIQKSNQAASLIAVLTTVLVVALIVTLNAMPFEINSVLALVVIGVAVALISYIVARVVINLYVSKRVKLIFKIIHDIKSGSEQEEDQIAKSSSIAMVEKEVMEWAEERKSELDELKVREAYRREFIGNVSHELKTPIFNIQGYILTLLDGGLHDESINERYLKRASKSVDRLISLVQDMDTLNKLESGILEIRKVEFAVEGLIHDVIDMLEDSARKRKVKLTFQNNSGKKNTTVFADPSRIEQVLVNLIMNGIKYGRKNEGEVSVTLFDLDDRFLVEVADNGMGIPESDISRIFERFYRVDKSRTRDAGGSGLGLSIVKHIIDGHQETINVRSTVDVGSTFSFTLKKV